MEWKKRPPLGKPHRHRWGHPSLPQLRPRPSLCLMTFDNWAEWSIIMLLLPPMTTTQCSAGRCYVCTNERRGKCLLNCFVSFQSRQTHHRRPVSIEKIDITQYFSDKNRYLFFYGLISWVALPQRRLKPLAETGCHKRKFMHFMQYCTIQIVMERSVQTQSQLPSKAVRVRIRLPSCWTRAGSYSIEESSPGGAVKSVYVTTRCDMHWFHPTIMIHEGGSSIE